MAAAANRLSATSEPRVPLVGEPACDTMGNILDALSDSPRPIDLLESWETNEHPVLRVANCESPRAAIAVARGALTTTKK
jgi:hypothetical protein